MVGWGGDGKMGVERSGWRDGGGEMGVGRWGGEMVGGVVERFLPQTRCLKDSTFLSYRIQPLVLFTVDQSFQQVGKL